jgi:hypothetical protein
VIEAAASEDATSDICGIESPYLTADYEGLIRKIKSGRMSEKLTELELLEVAICNCLIHSISIPNPLYIN